MRSVASVLLLVMLTAASSGCVANMEELKEFLGAVEPEPEPVYDPPVAKAQANRSEATVGVPVRFTATGSHDPQGLALEHAWEFGDGAAATGASVEHAFAAAGDHTVRLRVTNAEGLTDEDVLVVAVSPADGAPTAAFRVTDARGRPTDSTHTTERLTFDAAPSADPEGAELTYAWDFGDGATSLAARATHDYARPGLFTVRLRVTDAAGLTAEASRIIAVNTTYQTTGTVNAPDESAPPYRFEVADGAAALRITLTFGAGGGLNDLELRVEDAAGATVATTSADPEAGAQGTLTREVVLATTEEISAYTPGDWTVTVLRERGVQVDYDIVIDERL